jgi:serine/threonine protein kinase/Tfp pilus assembly protein PilF
MNVVTNSLEVPANDVNTMSDVENAFKHYRLLAKLGSGGFGEVVEAWDTQLERKVAIKRLKALVQFGRPGGLLKEARLAASLEHPAFVKIYSIEEDGDGHAIVMELVRGATWRELIKNGEPDIARSLGLVAQLAEAMQAAHESGLVHGDLKPSNLMLDTDGKIRILDLGLAFHDDAQATSSLIELEQQGTIAYMAPERLLGEVPSRISDIYAVGVILYELLTGQLPHGPLSGLALAAAQMQTPSSSWKFPETMPTALADLIRSMTASRPGDRLDSMHAVATCIAKLKLPGETAVEPKARKKRPHQWKWNFSFKWSTKQYVLLGAAVAILAAAASWHFLRGTQPFVSLSPFSTSQTAARALQELHQFDRSDQLDLAAADFKQILQHDPNNAAAVAGMSLVDSFRYGGDEQDETWLQLASAGAQQSLKLDRQLALGHAAQAWALYYQGKREAALAESEESLNLEPDNFFASFGKVNFLSHMQRYEDAKSWLEHAIKQNPKEHAFLDILGTVYYEQGNYAAAVEAFKSSVAIQPDSVTAYANLNGALLRENRNDEALQVLQQGLRIRPTGNLYTNLGNALFLRGNYTGAADAFEQAVTPPVGNPNSSLGWANLGDTLLLIPGRSEQAREAYTKAKQLLQPALLRAPEDVKNISRMSLYCARLGQADESIALLQKAIANAPKSPDVHFRAGLAYELLGKRELALKEIDDAKKFGYPESAIASEPDLVSLRRDVHYR